ncbi:MAG TPA: PIG-L family deacetylase [Rhodanobacteraceae bacterium]|nr:PIG-L family deacetylase [Rhodanobacteraceae bacterium]
MTRKLTFRAADRLLVFAPHPDDETLATGELIQLAIEAGADVRVVFATDGDNNPWPQRWHERRLRIGDAERARWGARRREEARAALATLGAAGSAVRFLGWSDLGLTRRLVSDEASIASLADELAAFAPTHVALPSLRDRHPDHSALRVMLDLAIARAHVRCVKLGYVVHGRRAEEEGWHLPADAVRHARKRDALLAHESQIRLSRRRLLRWASAAETFEHAEPDVAGAAHAPSADRIVRIPLLHVHRFWRRHELLLVLTGRRQVERARVRLPRFVRAGARRVLVAELGSGSVTVELVEGTLQITFAAVTDAAIGGYIKLERTWPRLIIFDAEVWRRIEDLPMSGSAGLRATPLPQRVST